MRRCVAAVRSAGLLHDMRSAAAFAARGGAKTGGWARRYDPDEYEIDGVALTARQQSLFRRMPSGARRAAPAGQPAAGAVGSKRRMAEAPAAARSGKRHRAAGTWQQRAEPHAAARQLASGRQSMRPAWLSGFAEASETEADEGASSWAGSSDEEAYSGSDSGLRAVASGGVSVQVEQAHLPDWRPRGKLRAALEFCEAQQQQQQQAPAEAGGIGGPLQLGALPADWFVEAAADMGAAEAAGGAAAGAAAAAQLPPPAAAADAGGRARLKGRMRVPLPRALRRSHFGLSPPFMPLSGARLAPKVPPCVLAGRSSAACWRALRSKPALRGMRGVFWK